MKRIYETLLAEHLRENRQMAFLSGPRQVGKTTSARAVAASGPCVYLNWDVQADRRLLVQGPDAIAERAGLRRLTDEKPVLVFDEIHKYGRWKTLLKGFFDAYGDRCRIMVTGSGRLDVYKRGGDSLLGRYFLYRMHPLSVRELLSASLVETEIVPPERIGGEQFDALLRYGGFPEPFLSASPRFHRRWSRLRTELLLREDLRDLTRVQEVGQVEILAEILAHRAGGMVNYSTLANEINASADTIRRWLATLESLFYCFSVRPWSENIPKSLRKQPKVYLRDWSAVADPGARHENLVAAHLLKAVQWWTDIGLGDYGLYFLRDKSKREVDFLVTRDGKPWFLAEVKTSGSRRLSAALGYFQEKTGAEHAFQLAFDLDYVHRDCFRENRPVIVPVTTFLSQLV